LEARMVNVAEDEVPPPDPLNPNVFDTVTPIVAGLAISEAAIAVVNCVELTNVAGRETPLKFSIELDTKLAPVTVSVNPGEPATTLGGLMEDIVGGGR